MTHSGTFGTLPTPFLTFCRHSYSLSASLYCVTNPRLSILLGAQLPLYRIALQNTACRSLFTRDALRHPWNSADTISNLLQAFPHHQHANIAVLSQSIASTWCIAGTLQHDMLLHARAFIFKHLEDIASHPFPIAQCTLTRFQHAEIVAQHGTASAECPAATT